MKEIPVEEAVGMVLGHDVTRIIAGGEKGPAFRKGHIIQSADIPDFLDIGKQHIFVVDLPQGVLHEDQAAIRLAQASAGLGLRLTNPSEGRVNIISTHGGMLKVNASALHRLNSIKGIVMATLHDHIQVSQGRPVAGTRIIPLSIDEKTINMAEQICKEAFPLLQVLPLQSLRVGVVITGNEIYTGRIQDKFGPVIKKKVEDLKCTIMRSILVTDSSEMIADAITELVRQGAQMVMVTGGMSVDPDDCTPAGIRAAGGRVITYGAPVFPGAMFLLAYIDSIPVLGLPGCVMFHKTTVFDLIVPRLLVSERIEREDIIRLGHGGFCQGCSKCRYPHCGFGLI